MIMGVETNKKLQKIFRKFFKVFQSPKMFWNGFCAMKEHSKSIFCWLHFFHLSSIRVETYKNFEFSEKNSNFSEVLKWPEMDFALWKSNQKWFFCWLQFVQPSRVGKTQVLKWSEITQRAVRSSFCWQYFAKCALRCGKLVFIFYIQ